jgi:hypothetical protein
MPYHQCLTKYGVHSYFVGERVRHQIKGSTYKELTIQIGEQVRYDDNKDNTYYSIVVDYGWDIDPVYTKVLSIILNKDLIVTTYEVKN